MQIEFDMHSLYEMLIFSLFINKLIGISDCELIYYR